MYIFAETLQMISDKDWIDIFNALLTPTVALFGIYIGIRQYQLEKKKTAKEIFEFKLEYYTDIKENLHKISGFILKYIGQISLIRNQNSYEAIKTLLDKELVNSCGNFIKMNNIKSLLFDEEINSLIEQSRSMVGEIITKYVNKLIQDIQKNGVQETNINDTIKVLMKKSKEFEILQNKLEKKLDDFMRPELSSFLNR